MLSFEIYQIYITTMSYTKTISVTLTAGKLTMNDFGHISLSKALDTIKSYMDDLDRYKSKVNNNSNVTDINSKLDDGVAQLFGTYALLQCDRAPDIKRYLSMAKHQRDRVLGSTHL